MTQEKRNPAVIIVGAGMTGILMTIKLRKAGISDIIVLEKKDCVGGTWRENTYPGAACDVPAHMYTYSCIGWRAAPLPAHLPGHTRQRAVYISAYIHITQTLICTHTHV